MKSCPECRNYSNGKGNKECLVCLKYKTIQRQSGKRRSVSLTVLPQNILDAFVDDPQTYSVLDAIRALPTELSIIVSLIHFAGLTTRQAARFMRISHTEVYKKNKFALNIIRESLKN